MRKKQNSFSDLFPEGIVKNKTIPFVHKGEWAIHQLLPFLLSEIGPAHLSLATFNISEDSIRQLFFLQEEDLLLTNRIILDANVKRHKLEMLLFAANVTPNIHIANNHLKLMLLENENMNVGIIGSANLNNNPRYEGGIIFTNELFDYFKAQFEHIYNNDSILFEWS